MKMSTARLLVIASVWVAGLCAQSLNYSGTPALLNQVTLSMHGVPNQPYILAASDNPGPTVLAPLGTFELGYPPILIAGAIPGFPAVPALDTSGNVSMTFSIPFLSSLIGTSWWFQGVYFDPASPYGLSKTNGTHFTIADPLLAPTITGVTPNSGPAAGGTQVAITGTNFLPGGTTVSVGSTPLMNPVIATPTLILGTIPPGAPGASADITVSTIVGGSAVLADGFTYLGNSAPIIASVSPDHAPITGGGIFTLTGQGLGNGTTVYLNGVPCIALAQSPTSYVGIIPNTTTPGYATLVAASTAGVATLSNVFRYTIVLDVGNGSDGVFNPSSNVLIDTTVNGGIFNYTSFTIPAGVTVTARGPNPLVIKCTGDVNIFGTLDLKGEDAGAPIPFTPNYTNNSFPGMYNDGIQLVTQGTTPGCGGGRGAVLLAPDYQYLSAYPPGSSSTYCSSGFGQGATFVGTVVNAWLYLRTIYANTPSVASSMIDGGFGAAHGSIGSGSMDVQPYLVQPYGSSDLVPLTAGSGGCSLVGFLSTQTGNSVAVWAGASGGGAVDIRCRGSVSVTGAIDARGGSVSSGPTMQCGSGGGVRTASQGPIGLSASAVDVRGGTSMGNAGGFAGNGRWAIQSWNGTKSNGTTPSIPAGIY